MNAVIICTKKNEGLYPVNEHTPDSMLRISGHTPAKMAVDSAIRAGTEEIYAVSDFLSERMNCYFDMCGLKKGLNLFRLKIA